MQALIERFDALPAASLADRLTVEVGSMRDYAQLSEHHYRAPRPAAVTRVLVLRDHQPTVVGRVVRRRDETQVAAVLVESLPALACRMRDWALRDRYGSWLSPRMRARLLTDELRCISRAVVDPRWRGMGLAVRLVRYALAHGDTMFTEALAAMGRVHPFFQRAGMTAYDRPAHTFDARLLDAMQAAGFAVSDLAQLQSTQQRIMTLPETQRAWLLRELRRWFRHSGVGRARDYDDDPAIHLKHAQQRLLLQPVYYLHDNRTLSAASAQHEGQDASENITTGTASVASAEQQRHAAGPAGEAG